MRRRAKLGGGPFNAQTIGRLGGEVSFLGAISRDRFGSLLHDQLVADGVGDPQLVQLPSSRRGGARTDNLQPPIASTSPKPRHRVCIRALPDDISVLHVGTRHGVGTHGHDARSDREPESRTGWSFWIPAAVKASHPTRLVHGAAAADVATPMSSRSAPTTSTSSHPIRASGCMVCSATGRRWCLHRWRSRCAHPLEERRDRGRARRRVVDTIGGRHVGRALSGVVGSSGPRSWRPRRPRRFVRWPRLSGNPRDHLYRPASATADDELGGRASLIELDVSEGIRRLRRMAARRTVLSTGVSGAGKSTMSTFGTERGVE